MRRISTTYNNRSQVDTVTCWDDPDVGQGGEVNQVGFGRDAFKESCTCRAVAPD